jgi:hypothetical protein
MPPTADPVTVDGRRLDQLERDLEAMVAEWKIFRSRIEPLLEFAETWTKRTSWLRR